MDILGFLLHGFAVALEPQNLFLALIGCAVGTLIGALPGLGPVNGVALLIPLAFNFGLSPTAALILLVSVYYGTMYGGRISSIVLNIPGDEPAMMTTLDGYPMALKGRGGEALGLSAVASFVGATVATIGLTLFAPLLVGFAIRFGPAEYFALFMLAFATIGGVTSGSFTKSLLAACLGLLLGTVGLDPASGVSRYTFGWYELYDGIDFIAALVGLFAISECLLFLEDRHQTTGASRELGSAIPGMRRAGACKATIARGSLIGFIAGVLPGAGASLGSFLSYTLEKRWLGRQGDFGNGDPRGVAAPEAGNNAAAGGALIPMLSLGIPGSGTTAILLALLLSMNITPGPLLFDQQPDMVWGLVAALFIGNVMLLVLNVPLVGLFARVLRAPSWLLMPVVILVAFVGVYSLNNSPFDLYVMLAFGVLGYGLRKLHMPAVPVVLGLLLGGEMEFNLRRALAISGGDWSILVGSGISVGIYAFAATLMVAGLVYAWWVRRTPDAG
ncbi:tripartite tricarboxylate transporter permease [Modicisalibacter tunisiensis]|uniref:tripartite tricarboxylate transporter permease n=1 Tax=Modicisalibacter tunisiensis TaxID=390637 RepID=UPI000799471C|nr:tripartite tricarboxylate transporter permease [Modicisalibacter tunisiensis]KXS37959.1 MAG: putative tricarboxylic transport membrane protein [Halomonadaceae bacterium T82-2]MBZ9539500.1 tripartite tricarboxylate transporter permease [Modicisalibacter tunisiensis]